MDVVFGMVKIIHLVFCYPVARRIQLLNYSRKHVEELMKSAHELKSLRDALYPEILAAVRRGSVPTNEVQAWLTKVETILCDARAIEEEFQERHRCYPNCRARYKLAKKAINVEASISEMANRGKFSSVTAEHWLPSSVMQLPSSTAVGLDGYMEKIRDLLRNDEVGIIGLYGMGGVGKTTLLKKINNEFLQRTHDFDVVIWVSVSQDLEMRKIQDEIASRLGLSLREQDESVHVSATLYEALERKRFLLLLDDLWDRLELEKIGVPLPNRDNNCKVILTSRSLTVCHRMEVQEAIRVESLSQDEALNLFQEKVGEETINSHPDIPSLAMIIADECHGLPLALITVGVAMRGKKQPEQWKDAIRSLNSEISGIDLDPLFARLKFTFDRLPNDTIKTCFLFCCLFPEDYSIEKEKLIDFWIAEGLLDEFDHIDEARSRGHAIIEKLIGTCFLESGQYKVTETKMHDLIRDFALWISSERGWKRDKLLVKAGVGLSEAPGIERWKEAERISLMANRITELKDIPCCDHLLTLMLQSNINLKKVSDGFFQFMPHLRVLDLSDTSIEQLPTDIAQLVSLRYLNLSFTKITQVPNEIGSLSNLRHLNLSCTYDLRTIPHGTISRLLKLQELNLYLSRYGDWEVEDGPSITELQHMENLMVLGITINNVGALKMISRESKPLKCTRLLCVTKCDSLASICLLSSFGMMRSLRNLSIKNCIELNKLIIDSNMETEDSSLSDLEVLTLDNIPNLEINWMGSFGVLQNLRNLCILNCLKLQSITWARQLQCLEEIILGHCSRIEKVISVESETMEEHLDGFHRLKSLTVHALPELTCICEHALAFPSLVELKVSDCPKLKKLPLGHQSARDSLREIRGHEKWWEGLEWEDENIKSTLLPHFKKW